MRLLTVRSPLLISAGLLLLNLYLAARLMAAEYLIHFGSIEPIFYAIARYLKSHWRDPGWWQQWFGGMPFEYTYQPLLHYLVAITSAITGWSEARAFHAVLGLGYSFGAVSVYLLARRLSGRSATGLIAALLYSLWSPSALLIPDIAADLGGLWGPRRLHVAAVWGDGPHVFGLTFLPLAVLALHRLIERATPLRFVCAALAVISVILTNVPAAMSLALGLIAYLLAGPWRQWITRGAWIVACSLGGYLLAARWLPMSGLQTMARNVQWMDEQGSFAANRLLLLGVAAGILAVAALLQRITASVSLRFAILFVLLPATVVLGNTWFEVSLIGQPTRLHLVLEMAICLAVAHASTACTDRWRVLRWAGIVVLLAACVIQTRTYKRSVREIVRTSEIEPRSEYKIARWFADHGGPGRVHVPGAAAFWLNAFVDTPQMTGCCEQNALTRAPLIANFIIMSDIGVPAERLAETSILWLRALGARYIAVVGPESTEPYKPFANWTKFDGVLPEVWRDGGDVIYAVHPELVTIAHFVSPADLIQTAPAHGADVEPLRRYAAAVIDPANTASAEWSGTRRLQISGIADPGDALSIQIAFHEGWRAESNGQPLTISRDALGLMAIESPCEGVCSVDLTYDGGAEARISNAVTIAAWAMVGILAAHAIMRAWKSRNFS